MIMRLMSGHEINEIVHNANRYVDKLLNPKGNTCAKFKSSSSIVSGDFMLICLYTYIKCQLLYIFVRITRKEADGLT